MSMTALQALLATSLLACSLGLASLAHAADNAGPDCVPLSSDQQIVRAGADRNVLLRSADAHYIVHFSGSCQSATISRQVSFATAGEQGQPSQLCSNGSSQLKTDRSSCAVVRIEPIDASRFTREARRRSR